MSASIEDEKQLKNVIESRDLEFSDHAEIKLKTRSNVSSELVSRFLEDFSRLDSFEFQPSEYGGEKYSLVFDKSSTYYLHIVLSVYSDKIVVVTAYQANKNNQDKDNLHSYRRS
ncbi:hypothetical protein [Candidatus Nanohalococcus occultus]|uniref:Uncharacterized protein n=1 Tax=Candidatus Nanohalococcus occultus TaxID=2978047 RepID=A0ABY8CDQ7_9ARCH|nr:hypothetical protein SVXNc_0326 [Candidatus Nanohaloarchaeota archaeon SVXNc]